MEFFKFSVNVVDKIFKMDFKNNKVYCLHNTGNNFETIFFSERNENYFKKKIKTFIKPFADVLYTSLQHNQFFIVIKTKKKIDLKLLPKNIGIMLGSYARGVNKEQQRAGSLFRKGTKAYKHFSDFPTHIRKKFQKFRAFFKPSRLVKFKKSITQFLQALEQNIKTENEKFGKHKLYEVLNHPFNYRLKDFEKLKEKMSD